MQIVIVCKGRLECLPPVMQLAHSVGHLGHQVRVITGLSEENTKITFAKKEIHITDLFTAKEHGPSTSLGKMRHWSNFGRRAWKCIKENGEDTLLWIASADTALALGRGLLRRDYVLQIHELYDRSFFYRHGLAKYAREASCVVVPEISRAGIFRCWYHLRETPHVLPNKPFCGPCDGPRANLNDDLKTQLDSLQNKKLLLYQAANVRMDLTNIARAVNDLLGKEYVLGILGNIRDKEMFARVKGITTRLVHFGYVRPPSHLLLTQHAYLGIMIYNYESLNNLFCAPNKTWEYSACGVPMVCNRLPALQTQLATYGAGEAFEYESPEEFAGAVQRVASDYDSYVDGAKRLYNSLDLQAVVQRILDGAKQRVELSRC